MYKLEATIDKEEIITRYIKLDLNNCQVELTDIKKKYKVCRNVLKFARFEMWAIISSSIMYVLVYMYTSVAGAFS